MDEEVLTTLKILIVGECGVGKSSLLLRFIEGTFDEEQAITIGIEFRKKTMRINDKKVKLSIWDTAGQERFRALNPNYYREAHGAILVYDVSNQTSFTKIKDWLNEIDIYSTKPNIVKMIVGNKKDLNLREVSTEDGIKLARRHGALFIESSAKLNANIEVAFHDLVSKILETPGLWKYDDHDKINLEALNDDNNSGSSWYKCTGYSCYKS